MFKHLKVGIGAVAVTVMGVGMASPALAAGGVHCNSGGNLATAIAAAPAGSSISVDGTCNGNFVINKDLQLNGAATLRGTVTTLTVTAGSVVTLNSITVTGGTASGIVNHGDLKMSRGTVAGNAGTNGAGIFSDGIVLLNSTTVSNNHATANGGGVYTTGNTEGRYYDLPPLSVAKGTFTSNTAVNGGAIWGDSNVEASSTSFTGNTGTYTAPYIGVNVPVALLSISHCSFS